MGGNDQELLEPVEQKELQATPEPQTFWRSNIKIVRRIIIAVVGTTVLLIGVALLVLPGPAFIVIPVGLAILATEFAWAKHWLKKVKNVTSRFIPGRQSPDR